MKLKMLAAFISSGLMFAAALTAADPQAGLSGKWATDAVLMASSSPKDKFIPRNESPRCPKNVLCGNDLLLRNLEAQVPGALQAPTGALAMELKASKTRLSGKVIDFEVVDGKFGIDDEKLIDERHFEFVVYKKINKVKLGTFYRGELVDPMTIKVVRMNQSGNPVDRNPDGTPEALIFHRVK